jgi:hypothetical protein
METNNTAVLMDVSNRRSAHLIKRGSNSPKIKNFMIRIVLGSPTTSVEKVEMKGDEYAACLQACLQM